MNNLQNAAELAKCEFGFHPSEVESRLEQSLLLRIHLRQTPPLPPHKGHLVSQLPSEICWRQCCRPPVHMTISALTDKTLETDKLSFPHNLL